MGERCIEHKGKEGVQVAVVDQNSSEVMSEITTYLLVSSPESTDDVTSHPAIEKYGLRLNEEKSRAEDTSPVLHFSVSHPIEEHKRLIGPARQLSDAFPQSTVTLCMIEERFSQIERVHSVVFMEGQQVGEVEHGYVYNVGGS